MKKNTVNKLVSLVVVLALLAATCAGVYLGIFGRNTQMVTIRENGEDTQQALYRQVAFIPNTINENWQEAIIPSAALGGGYSYSFTAEQGELSDKDFARAMKSAASVLKARAALISGDASATVDGSTVTVIVPEESSNSLLSLALPTTGHYELVFADSATGDVSETALTAEHIKQAYYSSSNSTVRLQLELNKKGTRVMEDLKVNRAGESLYLLQDGAMLSNIALNASTSTSLLELTISDWSYAYTAVTCLRSGELPVALTLASSGAADASMGAALNIILYVAAAALLLVCVWLVVRCRLSGLVGVWGVVAQAVLFGLCTALISVNASWRMSLLSLIVLLVCEAVFLYSLIVVMGHLASSLQSGRGVRASVGDAFGKHLKVIGIAYGVLLAAGLVLMFAFQGGVYGVLGRIMMVGAAVSAAIVFVGVRVVLSCLLSLTGDKAGLYGPSAR